jgi:hypothetical protein
MSIVAMMQDAAAKRTSAAPSEVRPARGKLARRRAARAPSSQEKTASVAAAAAMELVRYIPTEAVALYTAILPLLVPEDKPLEDQSYGSRWALAGIVGALAVLFAVGIYRRELQARGKKFTWPPKRTLTVVFAYIAWVFVVPGSPFQDFGWYTPTLGAIVGLLAVALLALFTLWFGGPEEPVSEVT